MSGIDKVWKTVARRDARAPVPGSTIPRALASLKAPAPDASWDDDAEPSETRSAERFVPLRSATTLNTSAGKRVPARIINMSRTGIAVEADFGDVSPLDVVTIGTRPVTSGRRIALGAVFMFKKPLDPKLCDPSIIL